MEDIRKFGAKELRVYLKIHDKVFKWYVLCCQERHNKRWRIKLEIWLKRKERAKQTMSKLYAID